MASSSSDRIAPVQHVKPTRFSTEQDGWRVLDMELGPNSDIIALSGGQLKTGRTYIDLLVFDPDYQEKYRMIYSREFEGYEGPSSWRRLVSFLSESRIVTCCTDQIESFDIHEDVNIAGNKLDGSAASMTVSREGEIYVGLYPNKVVVLDADLVRINTITLSGIDDDDCARDIAVMRGSLFVCTFPSTRALVYSSSGELRTELTAMNQTRAWSIAVSSELVWVVWDDSTLITAYDLPSLTEGDGSSRHLLFSFVVDGALIIRVNDNRLVTVDWTGELRTYSMRDVLSYLRLKEALSAMLDASDCPLLAKFFALPESSVDAITGSTSPTESLFLHLEERGIIQSSNVSQLTKALEELNITRSLGALCERYMETRGHATEYRIFLTELSTHLTRHLPAQLCDYFNFNEEKRDLVISSENPGLELLTKLDVMGHITQSDVSRLLDPLQQHLLLQAKARVEEYHTSIAEQNVSSTASGVVTLDEKLDVFLKCLKRKTKSYYETMTPLPWRKSCRWRTTDLFVASGLVLTDSKSRLTSSDVDPSCKLQYTDIFTHRQLSEEARIIIEGEPGSGKTMLASQLAYDWSNGKLAGIKMLILLPLKLVERMTIIQAIKQFYIPDDVPLSEDDIKVFLANNRKKKIYLVLDGVEEYNPSEDEPSEVAQIMDKQMFPAISVILTARSDYIDDIVCPILKLGRFEEDERNAYLQKVFPDDKDEQQKVKEFLENSSLLLDLCSIPLLFVLVVHNKDSLGDVTGQPNSVSPFMEKIVNILCKENISDGEAMRDSLLARLAFNGLCTGHQQLLWPKEYFDTAVGDSKKWTDSGILVVEDDSTVDRERYDRIPPGGANADTPVEKSTMRESNSLDVTNQAVSASTTKDDTELGKNRKNPPQSEFKTAKNSALNTEQVPLRVRFLHKLVHEWFAAKHFASMLSQAAEDNRQQLLGRHMAKISPSDLHYVLRFTCFHCSLSCHLIIEYLLHECRANDGTIPEHIMDCICLSFAEYIGDKENPDLVKVIHEVCDEIITIRASDSRLLQQSKVSLLKHAASAQIGIRHLRLFDTVIAVKKETLHFNTGVMLDTLPTLRAIEITRWDQKLDEKDYRGLITFSGRCQVGKIYLNFPSQPPHFQPSEASIIKLWNPIVEWKIGERLIHTLDTGKGEWMLKPFLGCAIQDGSRRSAGSTGDAYVSTSVREHEQTTRELVTDTSSDVDSQPETHDGAPDVKIPSEIKVAKDSCLDSAVAASRSMSTDGGVLEIPNTGVKLEVPRGALEKEQIIEMRIIENVSLEGTVAVSFACNSTVVVDLLPNGLTFWKAVRLILPHCLKLKKEAERHAKVYKNHQEKGRTPKWEETECRLRRVDESHCAVNLFSFTWVTVRFRDKDVLAKHLIVFAARGEDIDENTTQIIVGCYPNITGKKEILQEEGLDIKGGVPFTFLKKDVEPRDLHMRFIGTEPGPWVYNSLSSNLQTIDYERVAMVPMQESMLSFIMSKTEDRACLCRFEACQGTGSELKPIQFWTPIKVIRVAQLQRMHRPAVLPADAAASNTKQTRRQAEEDDSSSQTLSSTSTVDDVVILTLSKKIPAEWKDVARNLAIPNEKIEGIGIDNSRSTGEAALQMLLYWKRQSGSHATYTSLAGALRKAGRVDLQEEIMRQHDSRISFQVSRGIRTDRESANVLIGMRLPMPPPPPMVPGIPPMYVGSTLGSSGHGAFLPKGRRRLPEQGYQQQPRNVTQQGPSLYQMPNRTLYSHFGAVNDWGTKVAIIDTHKNPLDEPGSHLFTPHQHLDPYMRSSFHDIPGLSHAPLPGASYHGSPMVPPPTAQLRVPPPITKHNQYGPMSSYGRSPGSSTGDIPGLSTAPLPGASYHECPMVPPPTAQLGMPPPIAKHDRYGPMSSFGRSPGSSTEGLGGISSERYPLAASFGSGCPQWSYIYHRPTRSFGVGHAWVKPASESPPEKMERQRERERWEAISSHHTARKDEAELRPAAMQNYDQWSSSGDPGHSRLKRKLLESRLSSGMGHSPMGLPHDVRTLGVHRDPPRGDGTSNDVIHPGVVPSLYEEDRNDCSDPMHCSFIGGGRCSASQLQRSDSEAASPNPAPHGLDPLYRPPNPSHWDMFGRGLQHSELRPYTLELGRDRLLRSASLRHISPVIEGDRLREREPHNFTRDNPLPFHRMEAAHQHQQMAHYQEEREHQTEAERSRILHGDHGV